MIGVEAIESMTHGELVRECKNKQAVINHLNAELEKRPRTEFYAVAWWDGGRAVFEPDFKPVRGMLLFRPLPPSAASHADNSEVQPKEK